jgi:hypothetical protein
MEEGSEHLRPDDEEAEQSSRDDANRSGKVEQDRARGEFVDHTSTSAPVVNVRQVAL